MPSPTSFTELLTRHRSQLGLLVALAMPGGCAAAAPPLLDISAHSCASAPDLVAARPVALGDPQHPGEVVPTIDEHAPCVDGAAGKSLYASFQLPESSQPYIISVRSTPLGAGIFAPRLMLFDGQGSLKREVPRDAFVYRGDALSVLIRSRPDERFLVVASTPQTVGQSTACISEHAQTSTNCSTFASITVASGSDTERKLAYAHGGIIRVHAAVIPPSDQLR